MSGTTRLADMLREKDERTAALEAQLQAAEQRAEELEKEARAAAELLRKFVAAWDARHESDQSLAALLARVREECRRDAVAACREVNASLPSPRSDVAKRCAEAIENMGNPRVHT